MCTVTVIPLPVQQPHGVAGFRLVSNRDERRTRGAALPPCAPSTSQGVSSLWPIDSDSGGTWISVNASGVALTILNVYKPEIVSSAGQHWVSRGLVIPVLASSPTAADAAARLPRLDLARFHPFRLIAADRHSLIECRWDGGVLDVAEGPLGPACFSSHGWGDRHARHRLMLFRRWFGECAYTPSEQDAYHRHRWHSRPEISVRMAREESRTVSITAVSVPACDDPGAPAPIRMQYEPLERPTGISECSIEALPPHPVLVARLGAIPVSSAGAVA